MPFQYTNRRGDVYHLQSKVRKTGVESYSFTRNLTGTPADHLPEGYEVRELPDNAQVVLRRIKSSEILPQEKQMTEAALSEQAGLDHFIVDVGENEIVIWLPDTDLDDGLERIATEFPLGQLGLVRLRERLVRRARYSKMMRFVLTDAAKRRFDAQRWCFLGSIDDWFYLDGNKPLPDLLNKYVKHLGKESFFDLM
jgi:hypothetical protein